MEPVQRIFLGDTNIILPKSFLLGNAINICKRNRRCLCPPTSLFISAKCFLPAQCFLSLKPVLYFTLKCSIFSDSRARYVSQYSLHYHLCSCLASNKTAASTHCLQKKIGQRKIRDGFSLDPSRQKTTKKTILTTTQQLYLICPKTRFQLD